jgi:hypothetical protein
VPAEVAERDRAVAIALLGVGAIGWLALVAVMSTVYPDRLEVRVAVAAGIGLALAITAVPLAWLAAYDRRGRIGRAGDWIRAARRGVLLGALAGFLAVLQVTGTGSVAIAVFAVLLVVFVEVTLSYRR